MAYFSTTLGDFIRPVACTNLAVFSILVLLLEKLNFWNWKVILVRPILPQLEYFFTKFRLLSSYFRVFCHIPTITARVEVHGSPSIFNRYNPIDGNWISIDGNPWEWHGSRWESIFHRWESMGIDFKSILKAFIMDFRGIGKWFLGKWFSEKMNKEFSKN